MLVQYEAGSGGGTGGPRKAAKIHAQEDIDLEQSIRVVARQLSIRPALTALARWFPGDPPPTTFNRHATAHCIGNAAVFTETFALMAVMLACSMALQFQPQ